MGDFAVLTTELLSRLQFATTISFHILFPAFSIGLVTFLAIIEGLWLATANPLYLSICKFWTKIFALTFGMGVVSGIVMEFQLGTNWAGYTKMVGPVLGPLFTYEVLTAFFIEAGFLGVMIFGWNRVSPRLHYVSTLLVVLGVTLSAFWIDSANSWMHTPSGAHLEAGVFVVDSWYDVIFNPSVLTRFTHMMLAAYLCTAFAIAAIAAHYLLNNRHLPFAKTCFSFALLAITILIPAQIYMGDKSGLVVLKYQPMKTAAMEGNWETQKGAPLLLFALPDQEKAMNRFEIGLPKLASLINTHDWDGEIPGLKSVPPENRPRVAIVFWTFRIMVGLGFLMLFIAGLHLALRARGRLYDTRWFLKLCRALAPIGFIAMLTGWFTTEVGRQPWVVYGLLRTADAVSAVPLRNVIISLILIILVYGIIFGVFYFLYLFKTISAGPIDQANVHPQPFGYMEPPQVEQQ